MHETSPQPLDPKLLGHIGELNSRLLELLAATARGQATGLVTPVVPALRAELLQLRADGLQRLASCPYLLLELGTGALDSVAADASNIHEPSPANRALLATSPGSPIHELTRRAFLMAWHFATTNPLAVRITLGFSAADCAVLGTLPLPAIEHLAAKASVTARLRWEDRIDVWRQLLLAAGDLQSRRLRQLQLQGLQLLAGRLLQSTGT
jgi:hypothetical protein